MMDVAAVVSEENYKILQQIMKVNAIKCSNYMNVDELLKELEQEKVIIVEDNNDGEAICSLRKAGFTKDIIAIIDKKGAKNLPRLLRSGIADCLVKPVSRRRLHYSLLFIKKRARDEATTYSQHEIDETFFIKKYEALFNHSWQKDIKGINKMTLSKIWGLLRKDGCWKSICEVAAEIRLSKTATAKYIYFLHQETLLKRRYVKNSLGRPRQEFSVNRKR